MKSCLQLSATLWEASGCHRPSNYSDATSVGAGSQQDSKSLERGLTGVQTSRRQLSDQMSDSYWEGPWKQLEVCNDLCPTAKNGVCDDGRDGKKEVCSVSARHRFDMKSLREL